ncbi:MAG: hypothetical protein HUJ51_01645 [Eggerthellaceae bacterium]|nr:hypothetical protein [Eggerthellaceae bacterium]
MASLKIQLQEAEICILVTASSTKYSSFYGAVVNVPAGKEDRLEMFQPYYYNSVSILVEG